MIYLIIWTHRKVKIKKNNNEIKLNKSHDVGNKLLAKTLGKSHFSLKNYIYFLIPCKQTKSTVQWNV